VNKYLTGALIALATVAAAASANAATFTDGTLSADFSFAQNFSGTIADFAALTAQSTNGAGYNSSASSGPLSIFSGAGTITLNGAQVVNGSASGDYAAPNPSTPLTTNYISVYNAGTATFTITQGTSQFGIEWGSVDASNTLTFYGAGNTLLGTITGTDIVNTLPGVNTTGGPGDGTNWNPGGTIFADIISTAPIFSVVAGTGQNSFEFGMTAVSPVPLPAALPLFGVALMGLAGFGWRKTRSTKEV
jgi:hypothetical protein